MSLRPRIAVSLGTGFVAAIAATPWMPTSAWWAAALLAALVGLIAGKRGALAWGASLGVLACASLPEGPLIEGPVVIEARVVGAATCGEADVSVHRFAMVGGPWIPAVGRVRARFAPSEGIPGPGTDVWLRGEAAPLRAHALPGSPDSVRNALRARVRTRVRVQEMGRVFEPTKPETRDVFDDATYGGVLRALATGDRRGVDAATSTLLRETGTVHLLSISGFHIGLAAVVAGGALRVLLRALAALSRPDGFSDGSTWIFGAAVGGLYAWAAGLPVSAQRAALMFALVGLARALGRRVDLLDALAFAAMAVLGLDPAALGTASFQLSFGAILGMVRVSPRLLAFLPPDVPVPVRWLAATLATTLGAMAGTLPASAWWFQQFAPTAAFANVIALPWTSLTVVPCACLAAFAPDPLSHIALRVGDGSVAIWFAAMRPLATTPWAIALGPVGALLLGILLVLPTRPALVAVVLGAMFTLRPELPTPTTVTFLDIGQGDAALVEHPDGTRWLIDGGPPGREVLQWLRRRGVRFLDVVVASHGHPDHVGGLLPVVQELPVGELWIATPDGMREILTEAIAKGIFVRRPRDALHPPFGFVGSGLNDRSLVLPLETETGARLLFPGDIEKAAEQKLLGSIGAVDVLKIPHHGSPTSSTASFIQELTPRIAIASAGRDNPFGHPNGDVLARYSKQGTRVFRTDRDGTIVIRFESPTEIDVARYLPGEGWTAEEKVVVAVSTKR